MEEYSNDLKDRLTSSSLVRRLPNERKGELKAHLRGGRPTTALFFSDNLVRVVGSTPKNPSRTLMHTPSSSSSVRAALLNARLCKSDDGNESAGEVFLLFLALESDEGLKPRNLRARVFLWNRGTNFRSSERFLVLPKLTSETTMSVQRLRSSATRFSEGTPDSAAEIRSNASGSKDKICSQIESGSKGSGADMV